MHTLSLVVNSGRSGSTYLEHLLRANYADVAYIAHEDIPAQVSKPRRHNRAYTPEQRLAVDRDLELAEQLDRWEAILQERPIIETGWTASHLCPVLAERFGERFRIALLHRNPIDFAFSRASMGNYHSQTFYDDSHEVSPTDERSIAPDYAEQWGGMNHFEKCLYWWYVVYLEAAEFREKYPSTPSYEITSGDLFKQQGLPELLEFLGLDASCCVKRDVPRNELPRFAKETFPVRDEWRAYVNHPKILAFAESMGHKFDPDKIAARAPKYALPSGVGPRVRHTLGYWRIKSQVVRPIKKLFGRSE